MLIRLSGKICLHLAIQLERSLLSLITRLLLSFYSPRRKSSQQANNNAISSFATKIHWTAEKNAFTKRVAKHKKKPAPGSQNPSKRLRRRQPAMEEETLSAHTRSHGTASRKGSQSAENSFSPTVKCNFLPCLIFYSPFTGDLF